MKIVSRKPGVGSAVAAQGESRHAWKILVVDDEPDIRALTRLSLSDFKFDGRGLEFLEAASAYEARQILAEQRDVAMALIDVVMETEDAGLLLVEHIRKDLGNAMIRLVIRTGQPGAAPERFVIDNFDIDDYKDKTELSATRLYTTVRSALKAYRDLHAIELNRVGLEHVLNAVPNLYRVSNASLSQFFQGMLMQIVGLCNLDESSFIQTIEGAVGTFESGEATLQAVTGDLSGTPRFEAIRQACTEMILRGQQQEELRSNALVVPLIVRAQPAGFIYVEPAGILSEASRRLIMVMAQQCASSLENLQLHIDLHQAYSSAIDMLAEVAEYKDKATGDHINRIDALTRIISLELGLPPEQAELYGKASRLHDVGKIGIDDQILRKPSRLTPDEFRVMQTHTQIGARILGHHTSFELAREIAYGHHERWDASGYPEARQARTLSLATRIVSVADVFDALINKRPYKDAWQVADAVAEIEQGAGTKFDPTVVQAFLNVYRRGGLDALIASAHNDASRPPAEG
jgi:response regulator RpfG family c-di-GMP phosphodiesterase